MPEKNEKSAPTVTGIDPGVGAKRYATDTETVNKRYDDDGFWDLGEVRRKVYQQPTFADGAKDPALVHGPDAPNPGVEREAIPKRAPGETPMVPLRQSRPADNVSPTGRQVSTSRYGGSRYGKQQNIRDIQNRQNEALRTMAVEKSYEGTNLLIKKVEIKPWTTNVPFYQRFVAEAARFHEQKGAPCEHVPFSAIIPQYSKLNDQQLKYYLWVRDSIRNGQYPPADLSYLTLYIFEIINLPHLVLPEDGVRLLADIWLNYRDAQPSLDLFLSEWLADYCLIHGLTPPAALRNILSPILAKAPFKEFYLDMVPREEMSIVVPALLEFISDYDYRRSRYYPGNEEAYETHIPAAVSLALQSACEDKRGIFTFERKYRLTRDAYSGAVTPAETKRRIDIEFYSYTRPLETRKIITDLVKYAENRLRAVLKVKAKLGSGELAVRDCQLIDGYFAPMIPSKPLTKAQTVAAEEESYLKLYEAETSGFDFGMAEEIERLSWDNTSMLTTETAEIKKSITEVPTPDTDRADEPTPAAVSAVDPVSPPEAPHEAPSDNAHVLEKAGLQAALAGTFRRFCRDNGCFPDDLAAKINDIFIDLIGDIVLENGSGDYTIIEDYREEVTTWLN